MPTDHDTFTRDEPVVFVRGTGRCGSKNLVEMLGGHPQLAHVPVNQVVPEDLIDWCREHLQANCLGTPDEAVAAGCRGFFHAYGRRLAGPQGILLHKSTRNAHHLGTLLEWWPACKIIYLVRHPIGVVEALVNAAAHDRREDRPDYGYQAGVADSLLQWYTEVQAYLDSPAFEHPRLLQVAFEALVNDPPGTAAQICRFLGINDVDLPPYGGPEVYENPFVLNEAERQWIIDSTRDILAKLGHDRGVWTANVPEENECSLHLHPACRLRARPRTLDIGELTRQAIDDARRRGFRRIGLFGAGYFTRRACSRIGEMPDAVVGIFDDSPALANLRIANLIVRPPDEAARMRVDAVIPMTFVHQDRLIHRWRTGPGRSIPVLPLWQEEAAGVPPAPDRCPWVMVTETCADLPEPPASEAASPVDGAAPSRCE